MKNKRGISLITLVITIIVVIILAGVVILVISQNNPTRNAEEAVFKNDVAEYKTELTLWLLGKDLETIGNFDRETVNKQGEAVKEIIVSLKTSDIGKFEIREGTLVYIITVSNQDKEEWAKQIDGIIVESRTDTDSPVITFSSLQTKPMRTTVTVDDPNLDETSLQYIWDVQNEVEPASGWQPFTNGEMLIKTEAGTYYLWLKASDIYGNVSVIKSNIIDVVEPIYNFSHSSSSQTFTVPVTGTYKLEVWGAQGGGTTAGKGGYAKGNVSLTQGQTIYVYVGGRANGQSAGFNGAGIGGNAGHYGYGGGGATDIRIGGTATSNRKIVAGGGGGSGSSSGGYGGGTTGGNASGSAGGGKGGTQSAGGAGGNLGNNASYTSGTAGSSAKGGAGASSLSSELYYGAGGGGGGYYGGGGGATDHSSNEVGYGGGGGSSYVGGVTSGQIIAGNASMPNPDGGTMVGRMQHGYARITYIGE